MANLYLRRVEHGREAYRVILKDDVSETEVGSIGLQHEANHQVRWRWDIDTVLPMREPESGGCGADRTECQRRFRAAWEAFAADPARLTEFLAMKRKRRS